MQSALVLTTHIQIFFVLIIAENTAYIVKLKIKTTEFSLICDKRIIKKEYDNFSLFAFLEDCKGVKIKGAGYTAGFYGKESLDISQGDQFGQSNYVSDDECEISLEKGTLLLIESND